MVLVVCCPLYYKVHACTSVLVSGKASKDGSPFILKNRDTPSLDNLIDSIHPRYSNSNFGVIDAEGGCAYYEVGMRQRTIPITTG